MTGDSEEFNALRAHAKADLLAARHEAHERVCTERYGNIDRQLGDMNRKLDDHSVINNERLNALSNRMWAAACSMLALSVVGIAGLVVLIITRGLK